MRFQSASAVDAMHVRSQLLTRDQCAVAAYQVQSPASTM
ncbi:Uncharacterised protein [Vibrio cholerae]|nr:Uncharacterised protein [Vibrio cholerae]